MSELVRSKDGEVTVNSKDIADNFGKTHRHVLEAIKNMECDEDFRGANFRLSYYTSSQNKKLSCFDLTRDGFAFLCMGFTGKRAAKWKVAYIRAFNEMEKQITSSGSMMDKMNEAIKIMEDDKQIASACGRALSKWRKQRIEHKSEVERLIKESQLVLGLFQ